jgi:hypothetical protein
MSFLSPLALIGLALVSLPVIIHLLARRRAPKLDFPTLRFLRETPSFRLHPRRIQQPLLLALRMFAVILLVLGIARPLINPNSQTRRTRLILVDASLSMRALDRAEAAREEARAIINRLAQGERATLISFSSEASVLARATADRRELLAAVEKYQPGDAAIDFDSGLATDLALLEREAPEASEIDLISDFQQSNLRELTARPLPAPVVAHAVGAIVERNSFLLDETVWKNVDGLELSAAEIISDAEGRSGARRTWTITEAAGERPDILWRTEASGHLTGRIRTNAPDDFAPDDERFFAFAPPRESRVLLIESDAETNLYLGTALEVAASSLDKKHSTLTRSPLLPTNAIEINSYALVAATLHGSLRADELRPLIDYAKSGGTLWLFLSRDVDTAALNALASIDAGSALPVRSLTRLGGAQSWNIGSADLAAPALRFVTENTFEALRAVNVNEGYALEPRGDTETLMRWSDGTAAFVSTRAGSGRISLLATSIERAASALGSSPALPSLAFSLLREASAPREPLSYTLGEALDLRLEPWADVKITDDAGRVTQTKARELMQGPLRVLSKPGIYRLESEKGVRFVALNTPAVESERALANASELQRYFGKQTPVATANDNKLREETKRGDDAWRYFLVAAFLLLLAELFVSVRVRANRQALIDDSETTRVVNEL